VDKFGMAFSAFLPH